MSQSNIESHAVFDSDRVEATTSTSPSSQSQVEFRQREPAAHSPRLAVAGQSQSVAAMIAGLLYEHEVEYVFGIPGGTIAPFNDALLDCPEIQSIQTRHENGAVFAAAGYAMTSGRLGVVAVTSGPGVLNALTGIASAKCDGVPLLILVGEVPRSRQGRAALQDGSASGLDIITVLRSLSKHAVELTYPAAAGAVLRDAIRTAFDGRPGPVVVTLPLDMLTAQTVTASMKLLPKPRVVVPPELLDAASESCMKAQRGIIFAGSGVRRDGASRELIALAERLNWPVMTTPKGKGVFPANHRLFLGVYGIGGHLSTSRYLEQGVDTLLAIGTAMGDLSTNAGNELLRPKKDFIHVDVDARQFGRTFAPSIAIEARAVDFCREMLGRLSHGPGGVPKQFHIEYLKCESTGKKNARGNVNPQFALQRLQSLLPEDTIYTVDAGDHYLFAAHYLDIARPDSYITMSGLGSMGASLGGAIGAKLAAPDRTVAVIIGDGGIAMTAGEIATAAACDLGILVFVMNNGTLGMVEHGNRAIYGRSPIYSTGPLDIEALASSFGASALRISSNKELDKIIELRRRPLQKPCVIDVRIDANAQLPTNTRFAALGDDVKKSAKNAFLAVKG